MYTIRYSTKKGGSGMRLVKTNEAAKSKLIRLCNSGQSARVEKNGITIGECYKSNGKWMWYIDAEA